MARGVLPTAVDLIKKHVNILPQCTWCHIYLEDVAHVFFHCSFARELWKNTGLYHLIFTGEIETGMTTFRRVISTATTTQCTMFSLICWGLWVRRNKWVWEMVSISGFGVKHMAMNLMTDWTNARAKEEQHSERSAVQKQTWCKPPEGWVKVNIDAACYPECDYITVGCVMRDECGMFLRARSNVISGVRTPLEAEALSMREALSWIKGWRTIKCVFESDSKLVIDAFQAPKGRSLFDTIIEDCIEFIKHYDEVLLAFVPRSVNSVVHEIVRATYSSSGLRASPRG